MGNSSALADELERARSQYLHGDREQVLAYYHALSRLNRNGSLARLLSAVDAYLDSPHSGDDGALFNAYMELLEASDAPA